MIPDHAHELDYLIWRLKAQLGLHRADVEEDPNDVLPRWNALRAHVPVANMLCTLLQALPAHVDGALVPLLPVLAHGEVLPWDVLEKAVALGRCRTAAWLVICNGSRFDARPSLLFDVFMQWKEFDTYDGAPWYKRALCILHVISAAGGDLCGLWPLSRVEFPFGSTLLHVYCTMLTGMPSAKTPPVEDQTQIVDGLVLQLGVDLRATNDHGKSALQLLKDRARFIKLYQYLRAAERRLDLSWMHHPYRTAPSGVPVVGYGSHHSYQGMP